MPPLPYCLGSFRIISLESFGNFLVWNHLFGIICSGSLLKISLFGIISLGSFGNFLIWNYLFGIICFRTFGNFFVWNHLFWDHLEMYLFGLILSHLVGIIWNQLDGIIWKIPCVGSFEIICLESSGNFLVWNHL